MGDQISKKSPVPDNYGSAIKLAFAAQPLRDQDATGFIYLYPGRIGEYPALQRSGVFIRYAGAANTTGDVIEGNSCENHEVLVRSSVT